MSHVTCQVHMSHIRSNLSGVTYQVSSVRCHVSGLSFFGQCGWASWLRVWISHFYINTNNQFALTAVVTWSYWTQCHHLSVPRMALVNMASGCSRSQLSVAVQKRCSYWLTTPRWPGRSIPGGGYSRNIEFWASFAAHSQKINIWNNFFFF